MPLPYDRETAEAFFTAFLSTPLGERLEREGLLTNANTRALVKQAEKAYGREEITVAQFAAVAKSAYLNGDLQPEPEPSPEPAPAPKPLNRGQELWRQHRIFTETHSAKECEAKARTDRSYAAYLHQLRVGEFKATQAQVPDAVVNLNERKPEAKNIPDAVKVFAEDFKKMSCQQWKLLTNRDVNPEHIVNHYMDLFNRACECGLL